jgi:hypothetical protein
MTFRYSIRPCPDGQLASPSIPGGFISCVLTHSSKSAKQQIRRRLREAQTWLPDGEVVGMKPFWTIHQFERTLLCGIANAWHEGEWHRFPDASWSDPLIEGFRQFDDHDRNKNTVDFGYWIGSSGMGELIAEQNYRRISLRRWQQEA